MLWVCARTCSTLVFVGLCGLHCGHVYGFNKKGLMSLWHVQSVAQPHWCAQGLFFWKGGNGPIGVPKTSKQMLLICVIDSAARVVCHAAWKCMSLLSLLVLQTAFSILFGYPSLLLWILSIVILLIWVYLCICGNQIRGLRPWNMDGACGRFPAG